MMACCRGRILATSVDAHDETALTAAHEELKRERQRADAPSTRLQETLREIDALTRAGVR